MWFVKEMRSSKPSYTLFTMGKLLYLGLDPERFATQKPLIHYPLIEIHPRSAAELAPYLTQMERYTHLLFTSREAVKILAQLVPERLWMRKECIAVGPATAELLPDSMIAKRHTAEGVIALLKELDLAKAHLFYPHSALARPLLRDYLRSQSFTSTCCIFYDTHLKKELPPLDWTEVEEIVFTSPSVVEAFHLLFGRPPSRCKLTPIGPVTHLKLEKIFNLS